MRYIVLLLKVLLFILAFAIIALGIFGVVAYSNIFTAFEIVEYVPDFLSGTLEWVAVASLGSVWPGLLIIAAGAFVAWGAIAIRMPQPKALPYYSRRSRSKRAIKGTITIAVLIAIVGVAAVFLPDIIPGAEEPDQVIPPGQSWSARNWFVAFDGAEWYDCTINVHITVTNTGNNVADFGHTTTAGYPSILYINDKYGQTFNAEDVGIWHAWYQEEYYPGESKSGTLKFKIDPRSERVWLLGPHWYGHPQCSFALGDLPSTCK